MFRKPFSFDGRIRRLEYGLTLLIYFAAVLCINILITSEDVALIGVLLYIPFAWFLFAQGAKRCHDRGRSGWWQLLPFYGLLLLFAEGYPATNEYGNDPKGRAEVEEMNVPE